MILAFRSSALQARKGQPKHPPEPGLFFCDQFKNSLSSAGGQGLPLSNPKEDGGFFYA
ncbi:MAG: hypothetical protein E7L01_16815 [Paenibacillus macerans]|uniref:hypothetical protein n=1 Tax=Paenibacillus macerans TaxID=44252 RepID=UPI00163F2FDA|nr:hypothetical protein [Paenibacillus macerans]MDU7474971.1 hypothetical protein [Paenibacillus macerans]